MVSVSTTVAGLSTPATVTVAEEVNPDLALLDINVRTLRVPKTGKTDTDIRRSVETFVLDPDGNEVVWVSRMASLLDSKGLATSTCNTYVKGFYRCAPVMWAMGFDPLTLTELQWALVRRWLRECLRRSEPVPGDWAKPLSKATVSLTETSMDRLYGQAKRQGLVAINPIAALHDIDEEDLDAHFGRQSYDTPFTHSATHARKRGGGHKRTRVHVPVKEIKTVPVEMQPRLREAKQLRDRALFTFCLDTGPRISEALSLSLDRYFPDEHYAMLVGKGLDGDRRVVPVADTTIAAIDEYLHWLAGKGLRLLPDEPVFRSMKAPHDPLKYKGAWSALRRRLKVTHLHPHALRHTAATDVLRLIDDPEGKGLDTVRLMLGHRNVATTERYLHLEPRETIAAVLAARARERRETPDLNAYYGPNATAMLADILKETDELA